MTLRLNKTAIAKRMAEKQLNGVKLAELFGVTKQQVSAMLIRGTCKPATAVKIANALGVSLEEIVREEW